jgi:hypothetical protein
MTEEISDIKNVLFVDIKTLKYKVANRTKGRLRLFLGEFKDEEFIITVDTIKDLEDMEQKKLRGYIKSMILSKFSIIF